MKKLQAKFVDESDKCWSDQTHKDGTLIVMADTEADEYVKNYKSAFGDVVVRVVKIEENNV